MFLRCIVRMTYVGIFKHLARDDSNKLILLYLRQLKDLILIKSSRYYFTYEF